MDTSRTFLCTVVHPKLLPGVLTDPGNPLRVELLVEVGSEELKIRASAGGSKGKIMGTEPFDNIERVTIKRLGGSSQRIEILRRSLMRMVLFGGIVLVFMFLARPYSLGTSALIGLIVGTFAGVLNFVLNGGLGRKRDVVRFHFALADRGKGFYFEVPSEQEPGLHQALLDARLSLEEPEVS